MVSFDSTNIRIANKGILYSFLDSESGFVGF